MRRTRDGVDGAGIDQPADAGTPGGCEHVAGAFHVYPPDERVFPWHDGNNAGQVIDGLHALHSVIERGRVEYVAFYPLDIQVFKRSGIFPAPDQGAHFFALVQQLADEYIANMSGCTGNKNHSDLLFFLLNKCGRGRGY